MWEATRDAKLFERLAGLRSDFTVCVQPRISKDYEILHKFLQFDTQANILYEGKTGKTLELFVACCSESVYLQDKFLLPTPMTVSHLDASIAQQHVLSFMFQGHTSPRGEEGPILMCCILGEILSLNSLSCS